MSSDLEAIPLLANHLHLTSRHLVAVFFPWNVVLRSFQMRRALPEMMCHGEIAEGLCCERRVCALAWLLARVQGAESGVFDGDPQSQRGALMVIKRHNDSHSRNVRPFPILNAGAGEQSKKGRTPINIGGSDKGSGNAMEVASGYLEP